MSDQNRKVASCNKFTSRVIDWPKRSIVPGGESQVKFVYRDAPDPYPSVTPGSEWERGYILPIVQENQPLICKVETHKYRIGDLLDLRPSHCPTGGHLTVNRGFSDKSWEPLAMVLGWWTVRHFILTTKTCWWSPQEGLTPCKYERSFGTSIGEGLPIKPSRSVVRVLRGNPAMELVDRWAPLMHLLDVVQHGR